MMTTKRKQAVTTKRTHVKEEIALSPLEEKVVRMRHGFSAPDDLVLEQQGTDNAAVTAELLAMEQRILAAAGSSNNPQKDKIVSALRAKNR